ncbi:PilZ domain-containing protein [Azohydromonas lata]|uniref:PilZ domain-containing protein n=1 Tax=Azohydromonas lata TaxID=45677 RepID=A0ABU5IH00_9BURK|nr:PilZ domain-containing protein [Azohydromonas lata]MDZ5458272.1 PilZ domain-containing protein [Azohydromonas lata]
MGVIRNGRGKSKKRPWRRGKIFKYSGGVNVLDAQESSPWANASVDRREAERKRFRALAELRLPNQQVVPVRAFDISADGIGVVSPLNIRLETLCQIKVRTPILDAGIEVFQLRARVTHSVLSAKEAGFMLGLDFENPPAAAVNVIKQYVKTAGWMRD